MKKKSIFIILGVLVVIIIAVIVAVVVINKDSSEDDEKEEKISSKAKDMADTCCSNLTYSGDYESYDVFCEGGICDFKSGKDYYIVDCTTSDRVIAKYHDSEDNYKAEISLTTACSSIDARGNLNFDNEKCKSFVCTTELDGKYYRKDCRK